jgi:hypothetical protein
VPEEWKELIIVPIKKKKDDKTEYSNYREISISLKTFKIFSGV